MKLTAVAVSSGGVTRDVTVRVSEPTDDPGRAERRGEDGVLETGKGDAEQHKGERLEGVFFFFCWSREMGSRGEVEISKSVRRRCFSERHKA